MRRVPRTGREIEKERLVPGLRFLIANPRN